MSIVSLSLHSELFLVPQWTSELTVEMEQQCGPSDASSVSGTDTPITNVYVETNIVSLRVSNHQKF